MLLRVLRALLSFTVVLQGFIPFHLTGSGLALKESGKLMLVWAASCFPSSIGFHRKSSSVFFAAMDSAQHPLSIESFSYSWLVNLRPSLESLDSSLRTSLDESNSFIEMDPRMPPSKRFFRTSQEFKFDFPISQSTISSLVHADELFSNGYVLPLFADALSLKKEASDPTSNLSTPLHAPKSGGRSSLRRCQTLSRQIFRKYLFFLRPLCRRIRGGRRASSRDEGVDHSRVKKWTPDTSPRVSLAYSADDAWRRSCDSESSIYEAVLHCKRSIEN